MMPTAFCVGKIWPRDSVSGWGGRRSAENNFVEEERSDIPESLATPVSGGGGFDVQEEGGLVNLLPILQKEEKLRAMSSSFSLSSPLPRRGFAWEMVVAVGERELIRLPQGLLWGNHMLGSPDKSQPPFLGRACRPLGAVLF
jgi:hypothetical protein